MSRRRPSRRPLEFVDHPALLRWVLAPLQTDVTYCEHLVLSPDGKVEHKPDHATYAPAISERILCDACLEEATDAYVGAIEAGLPAWTCAVCTRHAVLHQFRGSMEHGFNLLAWFCPECIAAAQAADT